LFSWLRQGTNPLPARINPLSCCAMVSEAIAARQNAGNKPVSEPISMDETNADFLVRPAPPHLDWRPYQGSNEVIKFEAFHNVQVWIHLNIKLLFSIINMLSCFQPFMKEKLTLDEHVWELSDQPRRLRPRKSIKLVRVTSPRNLVVWMLSRSVLRLVQMNSNETLFATASVRQPLWIRKHMEILGHPGTDFFCKYCLLSSIRPKQLWVKLPGALK
jgi:hypothetical protein